MTERYVLIRYLDAADKPRVGSGYIVRGSTVLTANHVAEGKDHKVECDDREQPFPVDPAKTVLSGTNDVDLGVLQIAGNPLQLGQLSFAQVDRGGMTIEDCRSVGFPRWTANEAIRQYLTKQIEGFIRTAERIGMRSNGGADGQLLRLTIRWREGDRRVPVPVERQLDWKPESPWGGMSGAAVTLHDGEVVIGVVHSHNYTRDPDVLTVTPLRALRLLSGAKQQEFCDALGIRDINRLRAATAQVLSGLPGSAALAKFAPGHSSPATALSDGLRDICVRELAGLNVQIPPRWDYGSIEQTYRECEDRVVLQGTDADRLRARDVAKALWLTAAALPVLEPFVSDFTDRQLQYLYDDHVHAEPDSKSLDGMLYQAAGAGIFEAYDAASRRGEPGDEVITALARFMLGIGDRWKARQKSAADADFGDITNWVRQYLGHRQSDIDSYLSSIRRRTWALIEFVSWELSPDTTAARELPCTILIQTVTDAGKVRSKRRDIQPMSEQDVEDELRDLVDSWLPWGNVIVDLFLPRDWLDAGVEDWELIKIDDAYETLHKLCDPHLRWAKHRNDPDLFSLLRTRFGRVNWKKMPENIPQEITGDPKRLEEWLEARAPERGQGTQDPPYYIGSSHGAAAGHDPLRALLRAGYGFFTWFAEEANEAVRDAAGDVAMEFPSPWDRKDKLPRELRASLRAHRPIIIWSDPNGRRDFDMPRTKSAGTQRTIRRSGTQRSVKR